jgi:pimeloyl-ACP methyl ester carboxylesterase/uncharacterized SAM-binding protein YcdF (DUF218 family)
MDASHGEDRPISAPRRFRPVAWACALLLAAVFVCAAVELLDWSASTPADFAHRGGLALAARCAVLVLGHPARDDGTPDPMQEDRVDYGVEVYRGMHCERLIVSGAAVGNAFVEADIMATLARSRGVAGPEIFIKRHARNTWENIGFSLPVLKSQDGIFIVSEGLHARRARRYLCRQAPDLCARTFAVARYRFLRRPHAKLLAIAHEFGSLTRDFFWYGMTLEDSPAPPGAALEPPQGRYFDVGGARIYAETQGHGPPVLFLHGGLMYFDNSFAQQRAYFAPMHTVIGIDQRGHGHSPDREGPLSYAQMAAETAEVIRQLGVGPVDVVGHSDGGNIGLLLARDHPELVRRLVVSGANLRADLPPQELQRRRRSTPAQFSQMVDEIAGSVPESFRADYARVSPDGPDHWLTMVGKDYQMWLTPVVITPPDLRRIQIPVLVMAGDHDLTSVGQTLEIYDALPQAQLFILPATGHGTLIDRAALANLAIREFLDDPGTP